MPLSPRLLFVVAGLVFAGAMFWPTSRGDAVAQARALVGQDAVILFSAEWCGYCDRMRADLTRQRIDFAEHDIEASSTAHDAWRRLGARGVPVVLVGDEVVQGYAPARVLALARQ